MLTKEYRISLPMSVDEYRIAQLYMIQKKSREESHGAGSGVEILVNEPYTDGPGGSGQYTYKIYHIGSHLPGWFRAILPKSALRVEEEAWNAYPYTKTRYKCPFVEKFVLEIETKYLNDGGDKENIFNLSRSEMKERVIDYLDIVKDPITSGDYRKEEDPKLYQSKSTKRGPLNDNWRHEYAEACRHGADEESGGKAIMTAYKLCRVEFRYWGMQNKIERFIHDIGLRKTMLRAHRQAWCWQDEYHGLKLDDIRRLERETQLALQETMAEASDNETSPNDPTTTNTTITKNSMNNTTQQGKAGSPQISGSRSLEQVRAAERQERGRSPSHGSHISRPPSRSHNNQLTSAASKSSIDSSQLSDWRFQSLEQLQEPSSDEDEFYDAQEDIGGSSSVEWFGGKQDIPDGLRDSVFYSDLELSDSESESNFDAWESIPRSSSMETLSVSNDEFADARSHLSMDPEVPVGRRLEKLCQKYSLETGGYEKQPPVPPLCKTQTLFLIIHGGSVLDSSFDHFNATKRSDYTTLKSTFDTVIRTHYPAAKGHMALRLVPCPHIGTEALNILSSLSPFGFDAMTPNSAESNLPWSQEFVPLGALSLFSVCSPEYQDHVNTVVAKANLVYMDFIQSEEGRGFNGQVCILADATGSILTYDALCRSRLSQSQGGSQDGSHSSDINEEVEKDKSSCMGSTHTLCQSEVCILADATGSILTYDALCRSRLSQSRGGSQYGSHSSDINEEAEMKDKSSCMGSTHTLCQSEADKTDSRDTDSISDQPVFREPSEKEGSIKVKDASKVVQDTSASMKDTSKTDSSKAIKETSGSMKDTSKTVKDTSVSVKDSSSVKVKDSVDEPECVLRHPPSGRHNSVKVNITPSVDSNDFARRPSSGSQFESLKFDFEVMDFFMLGSPLGLVLSYRKVYAGEKNSVHPGRPDCQQIYNLFHASDPSAFRIEPLINYVFKQIPPIKIARYNKFPMGDGESIQIVETMCHYVHMFSGQAEGACLEGASPQLLLALQRQASVTSTCSQLSAISSPGHTFSNIANVSSKWWGNKRVDYVLYCPEVLHAFPVRALPPLFHASFWESTDVVAFILRQVLHYGMPFSSSMTDADITTATEANRDGEQGQPKEKWLKRRTMYKVKNLQPNHRGNDVLVLEDKPQVLSAKFMYGPLDMTSLSGEKTDVHVMSGTGEWTYMGTDVTDGHGRLHFTVPRDKQLSQGIHPVKMVVRVDHTTTDMFLAVLPPKTETVIFSIDGSFTASVSIMGKDPKVKPGAVDVVRHWQELGYLILYVTARPDLQHNKVVTWLARHNFPHGMLGFMDGFSKEPIQQKFSYLRHLQTEANLQFRAGYGSSKDIHGYKDLGLKPEQIFIVGKVNKKQQGHATFIPSGYAVHLDNLMTPGVSRPASGNGVHLLRKSCFSLPAEDHKRSSKHARPGSHLAPQADMTGFVRQESLTPQTLITVADQGNTMLQPVQASFGSAVRARGTSPRPKLSKLDPPR